MDEEARSTSIEAREAFKAWVKETGGLAAAARALGHSNRLIWRLMKGSIGARPSLSRHIEQLSGGKVPAHLWTRGDGWAQHVAAAAVRLVASSTTARRVEASTFLAREVCTAHCRVRCVRSRERAPDDNYDSVHITGGDGELFLATLDPFVVITFKRGPWIEELLPPLR